MKTNTQIQQKIRESMMDYFQQNTGHFMGLASNARHHFGKGAVLKLVITGNKKKQRVDARLTNTRLVTDEIKKWVAENEAELICDNTSKILAELENPAGSAPYIPSIPIVIFSAYGFSFMRVQQQAGCN